jgi:toxin ParE1/3/4
MARVAWTEPALSDLDAIADYIALENPQAAKALLNRVLVHAAHLADHPEMGAAVPELPGSRYRRIIEPRCRIIHRYAPPDV